MDRKIDLNNEQNQPKQKGNRTMNSNGFLEKIGNAIIATERKFFNCVVRFPAHCIERLTGFNNFDLAHLMIWMFHAIIIVGFNLTIEKELGLLDPKMPIEIRFDLSFLWVPYVVLLVEFISGHTMRVWRFRMDTFFQGNIERVSATTSNRDRTVMGLLTILAVSAFYHYHQFGIKVLMSTVPLLYITLGLAKSEPYFNWQQQERRSKLLWRMITVSCILLYFDIIAVFARRTPEKWTEYIWVEVIIIILVLFKIANLHYYIRRTKYGNSKH